MTYIVTVTEANGTDTTTYTTRSSTKAYGIYDRALEHGLAIVEFSANVKKDNWSSDRREYEREQPAIVYAV